MLDYLVKYGLDYLIYYPNYLKYKALEYLTIAFIYKLKSIVI